ncbi:uncharacterized protein [Bemisia tabaci]|uniref:uncharacterized protein isoform X2 n=1 Tax=Bemisia tabaci TaxID=7038 RepID=UPI003B28D8BD
MAFKLACLVAITTLVATCRASEGVQSQDYEAYQPYYQAYQDQSQGYQDYDARESQSAKRSVEPAPAPAYHADAAYAPYAAATYPVANVVGVQHTVEVSKPVPVPVYKTVAVPVPQPVPVHVPHPVPVHVPHPVAVHVPQPVPVHVPVEVPVVKHVAYPVEKPVPYAVPKPYPVTVEKKVPVTVYKPYPVHVPVYKIKHIYHEPKWHKWSSSSVWKARPRTKVIFIHEPVKFYRHDHVDFVRRQKKKRRLRKKLHRLGYRHRHRPYRDFDQVYEMTF